MPAVDMKAIMPEFNCVSDFVVDQYLARAARVVDSRFPEIDREWATYLHAAHHMSLAGLVTGASNDLPAGVTSWKSGNVSMTFSEAAAATSSKGWDASRYGQEFEPMLRAATCGPLLVQG